MESKPTTSRFLERALLFTVVCHGPGMLSMLLLLLGLPGHGTPAEHITYINSHPWLWRIGWFPWQVTAFSDLVLVVGLVRTNWIPKFPAWIAFGFTFLAYIIEQPAEFRWMWSVPGLTGDYAPVETNLFRLTSLWAAMFYTVAAVFWSVCLAQAKTWSHFLTLLSVVTWGILLFCSAGPLMIPDFPMGITSAGVAVGFTLMLLWFIVVTEHVLAREHPAPLEINESSTSLTGRVFKTLKSSRILQVITDSIRKPGGS